MPTFIRSLLLPILIALTPLAASPARALGFDGLEMSVGYFVPDTSTPYLDAVFTPSTFIVGGGQETDGNVEDVTHLLIDFDDDSLTIVLDTILSSGYWGSAPFNGVIFTSVLPHAIASATVDESTTTMVGFNDSRVSFSDDQIFINWNNLGYVDGTVVHIDFTFVPEPAAGLLVGCGLLGLLLGRSRRA